MKHFTLIALLSLSFLSLQSQTIPDLTFGINGTITRDINFNDDVAKDIIVQPDGKILIACNAILQSYNKYTVARYNANGTIDTTFGVNGLTSAFVGPVHDMATSMALQADGKILVAGNYGWNFYNDPAIVRFNSNGSIDSTFGVNGYVRYIFSNFYDEFNDMLIQTDGKIVVAGRTYENGTDNFLIMRFLPTGNPDSTFGVNGKVTTDYLNSDDCIYSVLQQPDGKLIVSGNTTPGSSYFAAARYLPNGSLDQTFGTGGKLFISSGARFDQCFGMAIQSDSCIVLAGKHHQGSLDEYMIVRLKPNGNTDSTFASTGIKTISTLHANDIINDVIIQSNGKIILTGKHNETNAMIMRLTPSGNFDNSFGASGMYSISNNAVDNSFFSVVSINDSTLLAGGYTKLVNNKDIFLTKVFTNSITSGIKNVKEIYPLTLYPNPATGFVMIEMPFNTESKSDLNIYDISGNQVYNTQINILNSSARIDLPATLKPGLYIISIHNGKQTATQQLIIK